MLTSSRFAGRVQETLAARRLCAGGYEGLKLNNREMSRSRTRKFAKLGAVVSLVHVRSALGAGFRSFEHQQNEKRAIWGAEMRTLN